MKYILLFLLLIMSNLSIASDITEAEVRQLMNQMERAVKTQNADAIAAAMSDSVVIDLKVFNGTSYQEMSLDKAKYMQYLRASWNMIKNYTYRLDSEVLTIEADQATLKYEMTESMAWGNHYFKVRSAGTTIFKKENDKLLVVKVNARTI